VTGNRALGLGLAGSVLLALAWHGPGGAAARMARAIETDTAQMLAYYEMGSVTGRLERGPLRRRIIYRGQADDFQRAELVRLTEHRPGVGEARWSRPSDPLRYPLPLWLEAVALAMAAFGFGMVIAYATSLRRREERRW
jgi:hypothetical protein